MGTYLPLKAGRYGRIKSSDFRICLDKLRISDPIATIEVIVQTETLMNDGSVFETLLLYRTTRPVQVHMWKLHHVRFRHVLCAHTLNNIGRQTGLRTDYSNVLNEQQFMCSKDLSDTIGASIR